MSAVFGIQPRPRTPVCGLIAYHFGTPLYLFFLDGPAHGHVAMQFDHCLSGFQRF